MQGTPRLAQAERADVSGLTAAQSRLQSWSPCGPGWRPGPELAGQSLIPLEGDLQSPSVSRSYTSTIICFPAF